MKKVVGSMILAAALLGLSGQVDAASGYVNMEDVLSSTPAFIQAGRTVAAEQQRLQNEFNQKSKGMSAKDKEALAEKLNVQLAQKENQVLAPIRAKLRAAVEKTAKESNVDIVINAREVIYGGVDLTEKVKANMR
ncbi:MAG: OmpH family outer membrane protein [Dialister sp.]|nr:OmpH family outer membrane protein [Dialister sp.]